MSRSIQPAGSGASDWEPRSGKHARARLLTYVPPWIGWVVLWLLSMVFYAVWGRSYTARPWLAIGLLMSTTGLAWWVADLAKCRSDQIRGLAVASTLAGGLWLTVASLFPPLTRPIIDVYGFGGFVTCAFWSYRRAMLAQKGQGTVAQGAAAKLMALLDGARLSPPKRTELDGGISVIEVPVEVDRGRQTVADLRKKVEHMETLLGQREGSVQITKDPAAGDAGKAVARFVPIDPLENPRVFTGPDRPGALISEAIALGTNEDGTRREVYLVGDAAASRALPQWLIAGVTGSAKSSGMKVLATTVLCRRQVAVFAADAKKGRQTLAPLLGGLERVALTEAACKAMARAVKAAIPVRADDLGKRGFEQWAPGCGLTFLVVFFEEARWLGNSSDILALVEAARSVGIAVLISMQRPSHSNLDTDTRSQLTGRWCFGVEDDNDAAMALPEEVLDAGAAPQRWSNRKPGYSYLVAPGVPEKCWAMPFRIDWPRDDEVIAKAVADYAPLRWRLDDLTVGAMGALYGQCHSLSEDENTFTAATTATADAMNLQVSPIERARNEVAAAPLVGIVVDHVDDVDDPLGDPRFADEMDDGQSDDDGLPPLGPPIEPEIEDPDAPIGDPPVGTEGFRFGEPEPARKLSTEEARAVVQRHLRTAVEAGKTQITAADVDAMKPPTTRTRSWVRLELLRLCEAADPGEVALEQDMDTDKPGVFLLRVPADALAGAR
jgi:hypothetical protein